MVFGYDSGGLGDCFKTYIFLKFFFLNVQMKLKFPIDVVARMSVFTLNGVNNPPFDARGPLGGLIRACSFIWGG